MTMSELVRLSSPMPAAPPVARPCPLRTAARLRARSVELLNDSLRVSGQAGGSEPVIWTKEDAE